MCVLTLNVPCSYVCIRPGGGKDSDIVLTYPAHDPQSLSEYFGSALTLAEKDRYVVNSAYVCSLTYHLSALRRTSTSFHTSSATTVARLIAAP